jgi:hypothetical protein
VGRLAPGEHSNDTSGMRESQLRNVVNVAIGASNVEEIAAFILYQMGRSTNQRQWLYGDFGKTVVEDLMSGPVRVAAQAAVRDVQEGVQRTGDLAADADQHAALSEAETQRLRDQAHIALARLYLGYLNRLFYFVERGGSSGQGRWHELHELLPRQQEDAA